MKCLYEILSDKSVTDKNYRVPKLSYAHPVIGDSVKIKKKMGLSSAKKNLGKIAALLGIAEGLSWVCMTLIAIILHYWKPELEIGTTYGQYVGSLLYHKFILDDMELLEGTFVITGTAFSVFMWIYFVLSVLWCSISVDQITAIYSNKHRQMVVMRIWGSLTLFISVLDLVFTMLLAMDFTTCGGTDSQIITDAKYFCYLTEGIVMTMAARGFTLWVINIIFAIMLMIILRGESSVSEDNSSSLYSTIPRAKLAKNIFQPYGNTSR